ncbi:uncharacterized protein N0V89_003527 [Didymosphaeria variabile]|uniref:Uncharacterized protein n=1 Tax=Didymosphaeria variabile TaxID=1932322 RepID=A0A9W9CCC1_9PLEO|nr:uncharacterized protein N0V89_003527 [Didymosphaeria variabile]KAJ4355510.1 hypothetical protein N0V89_003527 [Didymosphaeria variabile]
MQASNKPASASASLAATKAFLRDRESNGALSNAAAAAALRTHTTTPTPVGETVTKRMVRKGSVSSQGSGSQQRPGLRRHSSSGSMTERSFRAPSPSRSSPVDPNAPPVPAVPKDVPQVSVVHRRNASLEPPARGGSPVGRGGGRGLSLDRGTSNAGNRGRGQPRAPALSRVVEDEQDGAQRSSINFSRPISPPVASSPTPKPVASARAGQSGWFGGPVVNTEQSFRGEKSRPKTSDGTSAYATQQAAQNVQNAAVRPVSTRAAHMSTGVEGARLATGSMRAKPSGGAVQSQPTYTAAKDRPVRIVDPNSPFAVYDPSSRKFIHKQDAMNLHRAMSDAEDPAPPYEPQRAVHQTHYEAPQFSQPARQAPQIRDIAPRYASASPTPEAPQPASYTEYAEDPAPAASPRQHGVAFPQDEPATFTAQDFTEVEDRFPAGANTSRKLESPSPEPIEEPEDTVSPKFAPNQGSSYPHLAPPAPSGPPSTQGSERSARTHSLSPPRSAHFAAVAADLSNGIKHQPPGRSVSPAKSALKASPSVSGRSHSPLANNGRMVNRGAPSLASDAASEDGGKKKKKVRISFDEEPTVVDIPPYGDSDVSHLPVADDLDSEEDLDDILKPTPVLPSFGSIRDKNRRSRDDPEKVTETVSSSLSNSATLMGESELSSDHKIGGILAQDFAAKSAEHSSGNDPLPPEVTSVEGSGYYSESSESEADVPIVEPHKTLKPEGVQSTPEPEPKTLTNPVETRAAPLEVPIIAVQPASPPIPQEPATQPSYITQPVVAPQPAPKAPRPFVPGGWDDDDASEPEVEVKAPEPTYSAPSQPSITIQIPERPVDDDSSDDNSSVYSDAYEDLEEGEGFASIDAIMESPIVAPTSRFASNNSSPNTYKTGLESSRWAPTNPDDIQERVIQDQRKAQPNNDWETSQQSWSEMNDSRKPQPQSGLLINNLAAVEEPKSAPRTAAPATQTRAEPKPTLQEVSVPIPAKSKERRVKVEPTVAQVKAPPTQPAKTAAQPRKSALKKATPTSPPAEVPLKKTMRDRAPVSNGPEPQMRMTMRGASGGFAGRGSSAPATQRQSMPPLDTKPPRGALQKRHLPAAAAGAAARPRPQSASGVPAKPKAFVPPAPTYDSDSDASVSSFQRERQRNRASRSNNNGGQYTMRASMRSGPTPTMRAAPPVRSISPPRTATSPPPSTLRKSMRPSSPTPESPEKVKSSRFSIRSLSPAGRFRRSSTFDAAPPMPPPPVQAPPPKAKKSMFAKSAPAKAPAKATKAAKPFKSRINDSSDEEEDRPRRFQSRFADSDSDSEDFELPTGLTPVRGIPKRSGEEDGDSTDLEDEASDNEPTPAPVTNGNGKGKSATTNGSTNAQGASLAAGSLRQPGAVPPLDAGQKKPKRGLFGFGKKKNSYLADANSSTQPADFGIPMPPAQQNRDLNRPLTPIGELDDVDAGNAPMNPPPKSGRRTPLERSTSDSWPLPSPTPAFAQDERPQSADGPVKRRLSSGRPTLVKRNPSQLSQTHTELDPKTGKEVSFGRTGKKKKFQGLRRVLGLND